MRQIQGRVITWSGGFLFALAATGMGCGGNSRPTAVGAPSSLESQQVAPAPSTPSRSGKARSANVRRQSRLYGTVGDQSIQVTFSPQGITECNLMRDTLYVTQSDALTNFSYVAPAPAGAQSSIVPRHGANFSLQTKATEEDAMVRYSPDDLPGSPIACSTSFYVTGRGKTKQLDLRLICGTKNSGVYLRGQIYCNLNTGTEN